MISHPLKKYATLNKYTEEKKFSFCYSNCKCNHVPSMIVQPDIRRVKETLLTDNLKSHQ